MPDDPIAPSPDVTPEITPGGDQPVATEAERNVPERDDARLDLPFRLEDVDEAHREHVQRYVEQTKPVLTRKFQEAATLRSEAEQALELQRALSSEDTRLDAIRRLLEPLGYELPDDGDQGDAETEPDDEGIDPTLEWLVRQEEDRAERETQDRDNAFRAELEGVVENGLQGYATRLGAKELPESTRDAILAHALALPALGNGLPDMDGAVEKFEAVKAAEIQAYLNSKRVTPLDTSGSSGASKVDLSNDKSRMEAAMAVAERHYATP